MKKKLLITLGCSYTEGVGCYNESLFTSTTIQEQRAELHDEIFYNSQRPYFHEFGWPNKLGKKLKFDKVINLGKAGSSTSGQLKVFFDLYYNNKFEGYDTTIFWLLTEPSRFSFYSEGTVRNFQPAILSKRNSEDLDFTLKSGYVKFIDNLKVDPLLDQLFYIKSLESYCQLNNFNLLLLNTQNRSEVFMRYFYKSSNYISNKPVNIFSTITNEMISPICEHPNELGYEKFAIKMFELIKENHPHLINTISPNNFEWEWNGDGICYTKIPNDTEDDMVKNWDRYL